MAYRTRNCYIDTQKDEMWDRWQRGVPLHSIARQFDRFHTSIRDILAATGGIRPPERRRSRLALTLAEREQISWVIVAGHFIRPMARSLGRAPSTVSRDIQCNGGRDRYRADRAPGSGQRVPSRVGWPSTVYSPAMWRSSPNNSGHPSRLLVG
jgi:hypothetical protein